MARIAEYPDLAKDQRRAARRTADIGGTLHAGGDEAIDVRLCDISEHGFRCEGTFDLPVGTMVALALGSLGPRSAIVRWRHAREIGCEFASPPTHDEIVAAFPQSGVTRSDLRDFRHWIFEPAENAPADAVLLEDPQAGWHAAAAIALGVALLLLTGSSALRRRR